MRGSSLDREAVEAEIDRVRSLGFDALRALWRIGRSEFDADHKPLAAHVAQELEAWDHRRQAMQQLLSGQCGVLDQPLRNEHIERRYSGRHGEIVAAEGRSVSYRALHSIEDLVEYLLSREDGPDWHVSARQRLGEQDHVRLDVPVLDCQKAAGAPQAGLDFVSDEQRPVPAAKLGRAFEKASAGM